MNSSSTGTAPEPYHTGLSTIVLTVAVLLCVLVGCIIRWELIKTRETQDRIRRYNEQLEWDFHTEVTGLNEEFGA